MIANRSWRWHRWFGLGLALFAAALLAQLAVPPLTGRVVDVASALKPAQRAELEAKLQAFESETGSQIAVLIVPTTQPEPIEAYSIRVVDAWQLGRKGIDDGLLVLLALQDRAVRIEVGRGLEGAIPDAIAKRIIEEKMLPAFRQGEIYRGLTAGLRQIMALIRGESLPPPKRAPAFPADGSAGIEFLALFAGILGGRWLRSALGPLPAALIAGLGTGAIVGAMGLALPVALFFGLFVFLAVLGGIDGPRGWYGGGRGGRWDRWENLKLDGGFSGGGASGRW